MTDPLSTKVHFSPVFSSVRTFYLTPEPSDRSRGHGYCLCWLESVLKQEAEPPFTKYGVHRGSPPISFAVYPLMSRWVGARSSPLYDLPKEWRPAKLLSRVSARMDSICAGFSVLHVCRSGSVTKTTKRTYGRVHGITCDLCSSVMQPLTRRPQGTDWIVHDASPAKRKQDANQFSTQRDE
jgi:hypothetical protein